MNIDPQWIIAAANAVGAISVVVLVMQATTMKRQATLMGEQLSAMADQASLMKEQLAAMRRQASEDHERSRRENAVKLLSDWSGSVSLGQPSARYIVERFTFDQCKKMQQGVPFSVPADQYRRFCNAFIENGELLKTISPENGQIVLNEACLFHLGAMCHKFVDGLEIVLIAWRNGTADKEIIEQQLAFLVKPDEDYFFLKNFRQAMGGANAYPNVAAFVEFLEEELQKSIPSGKAPLGRATR